MNDLTIKTSIYPMIIDTVVLNIFPEGNYEPLYVCDQYVITFGTVKIDSTTQIVYTLWTDTLYKLQQIQ